MWPTQVTAGMGWELLKRLWGGRSTFWDGGIEENAVVGIKNQRLDGVRRDHRHKDWLEITMRGKKNEVWVRDSEGGPCLFGILHVRGLRRAKSKPFLSLGRAIIVRNGEIIPMSREFTPETERQRLQLLVSENQAPAPFLVEFCASLYHQVPGTLPPSPHRRLLTGAYWEGPFTD